MLRDAANGTGRESVVVKDVAELVAEALGATPEAVASDPGAGSGNSPAAH